MLAQAGVGTFLKGGKPFHLAVAKMTVGLCGPD